jgi:hypothetical protein
MFIDSDFNVTSHETWPLSSLHKHHIATLPPRGFVKTLGLKGISRTGHWFCASSICSVSQVDWSPAVRLPLDWSWTQTDDTAARLLAEGPEDLLHTVGVRLLDSTMKQITNPSANRRLFQTAAWSCHTESSKYWSEAYRLQTYTAVPASIRFYIFPFPFCDVIHIDIDHKSRITLYL